MNESELDDAELAYMTSRPLTAEDADGDERVVEAALRPRTLDEVVGQERVREQLSLLLEAARGAPAGARPRAAQRTARARQDDAGDDRRRRDERPAAADQRPGDHPRRRPRGDPLRASTRATSSSSTRSTGCRGRPRRCSTWPWRTSGSTWSSARGRVPPPSRWRSRRSRWSAPPRGPVCCPGRCATGSASPPTWSSTSPRTSSGSSGRSAGLLDVELRPDGASEISLRSRGTPRIANRLLRRVRDYAQVRADGVVTRDLARAALDLFEVDESGLDRLDRAVLDVLCRRFGGGPVGREHAGRRRRRGARDRRGGGRAVPGPQRPARPHARAAGSPTPAAWEHLGLTPLRERRGTPTRPCSGRSPTERGDASYTSPSVPDRTSQG